jgi:hypothetical protein
MTRKSIVEDLKNAQREVDLEQARNAERELTAEQRETLILATQLIAVSRDMRRPGSALSESARIERLIKIIREAEA